MAEISVAIAKVALGLQEFVTTAGLSATVNPGTSLRDVVRMCFAEVGIEIAFSGKDNHEKGAVIDIDEELMQQLGLDPNKVRFGQTVVRVNASTGFSLDINDHGNMDVLVREMMASALTKAKQ